MFNFLFLQRKTSKVYLSGIVYPVPANLTYFWNFGVYALCMLGIQLITGFFLAMHYISADVLAFTSVEHIMRDVSLGWLLRYVHANGASFFFIVVYVHIARNFYYSSYSFPRENLWLFGVLIFIIMILTAFLGYVLPWGQMSFWAATVITNLLSVIPGIGDYLVIWLWGGYAVGGPTLSRFFSLHFLFSFFLVFLVLGHIALLHKAGSNNPLGISFKKDMYFFYPYYILKDFYGVIFFFSFFSIFLFFFPNYLGHPDNYIPSDPMSTPTHIVPEWYFLPLYAVLRSIPNKLLGVLLLALMLVILALIPFYIKGEILSGRFKPFFRIFFWSFLLNFGLLGWLGSQPMEQPFLLLGRFCTFYYFFYLLFILPFILKKESNLIK